MSDLDQHLFDIKIFGFTLVPDVLSLDEVAAIRVVNERLLEAEGEDRCFMDGPGISPICPRLIRSVRTAPRSRGTPLFGHYRVAPWIRFQCDPHRGFPEEWFDRLNDRQKELMRMHKGLGHPHSSD